MKRIIRQNRTYIVLIVLVFLFFLLIIAAGGRMIYEMETGTSHREAEAAIEGDVAHLRDLLESSASDVRFLGSASVLAEYLPGGEAESLARIEALFGAFARAHPEYASISFIEPSGRQRVFVRGDGGRVGGPPVSWPPMALLRAVAPGEVLLLSPSEDPTSGREVFTFAMPVGEDGSAIGGVVAASIVADHILKPLSPGSALRTGDEDHIYYMGRDGLPAQAPLPSDLPSDGEFVKISDTDTLHARRVEAPGEGTRLLILKRHSDERVKYSLLRLEIVAVVVFVVFFIAVSVVSVVHLRNMYAVSRTQKAIIYALANLSEWRDPETGSHLERTRNFAVVISRTLRRNPAFARVLTRDFIEDIHDAAPLHDIGKVGVRDSVLLKPARLTPEEFSAMKEHVAIGRDILDGIIDRFGVTSSFLLVSRNICHYHHERWDGSGYPAGLMGEAIPIEARIFAACDVYDALRADRPYKAGLSHEEALAEMLPEEGRHFDPAVLAAFRECSGELCEIFDSHRIFDEAYGRPLALRTKDAVRLTWSADLAVGVADIDDQHREFVRHVNALLAATFRGEGKREARRQIEFLRSYARRHFGSEEATMREHGYPGLDDHRRQHEAFMRNLAALDAGLRDEDTPSSLVVSVNAKVVHWLVTHIMKSDKRFGAFLGAGGASPALTEVQARDNNGG